MGTWPDIYYEATSCFLQFSKCAKKTGFFHNKSIDVFDCNCLLTIQFESNFNIQ